MELRDYQRRCLHELADYFKLAHTHGYQAFGARTAFVILTGRPYRDVPGMEQMPYVCLRVPTGGGKTLLAAHAIGVATNHYLQPARVPGTPTVLWLAPSNAIVSQTLRALRDRGHPYRRALDDKFAGNVRVIDLAEALSITKPDLDGTACVIVTTFQALRVDDTAGRKVYESAGALQSHFDGLTAMHRALFSSADGVIEYSLANVLHMRRPLVIMDEAHNARTPLSFATLTRFNPSAIIEFSATPERTHDPARGLYASNILTHVSALELKAEQMIKLPIRLQVDADWRKAVRAALDTRRQLAQHAERERAASGEYVRPIVLIQAQSVDGDNVNVDVLKQTLIDEFKVPSEQIAVHTGNRRGLDGVDVMSERCPVTCIITVRALVEGWDCPFAYVLCTVSAVNTPRAVEQVLGRILRLPYARAKTNAALNCAYAFAASGNFIETATNLRDALVEGSGFQKLEADELVTELPAAAAGLFDAPPVRLASVPDLTVLPEHLRERVTFEPTRSELSVAGPVSADDVRAIETACASDADRAAVRAAVPSTPTIVTSAAVDASPMCVPALMVREGERWTLFDDSLLLDVAWDLAACDTTLDEVIFPSAAPSGVTGEIDVSATGRVEMTNFVPQLHADLSLFGREPGWTPATLTAWLLPKVRQTDVTPTSLRSFVSGVIESVMRSRNWAMDRLASEKYRLADAIATLIKQHRNHHRAAAYEQWLFGPTAAVAASPEQVLTLNEDRYAPNWLYEGNYRFAHHAFGRPGELKSDGEEYECAVHLDTSPHVKRWLRNIDRRVNGSFWLQTSTDRFYPDFVSELNDGRWLVVEYKGADRITTDDSREKKRLGELWAERSSGKCVFVMPDSRQWGAISAAIGQA